MAAGVVDDDRMRNLLGPELESRQACALIARTRLVDPDVEIDAGPRRLVDGRDRRAPVDGGEPAGVAMGQDVEAAALAPRAFFNQP